MFSHNSYKNGSVANTLINPRLIPFVSSSLYIGRYVLGKFDTDDLKLISFIRRESIRKWIVKRLPINFWIKLCEDAWDWTEFCDLADTYREIVTLPRRKLDYLRSVLDRFYRDKPHSDRLWWSVSRNKIKRFIKDLYKYQST